MNWQPDDNLCVNCELPKISHAEGKCPSGPTVYLQIAADTHWHGYLPEATSMRVTWACHRCRGEQHDTFPLPVPSNRVVLCKWPGCGAVNALPKP